MTISTLSASSRPAAAISGVRRIFFATSSRRRFDGAAERDAFFEQCTGYYLHDLPEQVFLCFAAESFAAEKADLLGYLTGWAVHSARFVDRVDRPVSG